MKLNERIRQMRLNRNITMQEVAERLNVKEATVSRYETGDIKNLKYETIVALADIFGVTPGQLMGWENESDIDILTVELHNNPRLRVLMDAGKKVSAEDLEFIIKMAEKMNEND